MLSCPAAQVLAQEEELLGVVEDFRRFAGLDGSGQAGIRQAVHTLASAHLAALLRAADHHKPTHAPQTTCTSEADFSLSLCRCRKAVQQLLHAFRRLGGVLRGVLAPGVLVEVAASLIQSVCGQITGGCCARV